MVESVTDENDQYKSRSHEACRAVRVSAGRLANRRGPLIFSPLHGAFTLNPSVADVVLQVCGRCVRRNLKQPSRAPTMSSNLWARLSQRLASPLASVRSPLTANARAQFAIPLQHRCQSSLGTKWAFSRLSNSSISRSAIWAGKRPLSGLASVRRPFDPRFFSSNSAQSAQAVAELPVLSPPPVGIWLLASSAMVFAVIVVGGVTRLTESGLSITEWRPVSGMVPPLSRAQWEEEFDKYKRTPEFKL